VFSFSHDADEDILYELTRHSSEPFSSEWMMIHLFSLVAVQAEETPETM